jgi:hypothetical protein
MMLRIRNRTAAHVKWHSQRLYLLVVSLVFACLLMESAISVSETPRTHPARANCRHR